MRGAVAQYLISSYLAAAPAGAPGTGGSGASPWAGALADLVLFAASLLVLAGFGAAQAEASRCRRLPRHYAGGIDLWDRPPAFGLPADDGPDRVAERQLERVR